MAGTTLCGCWKNDADRLRLRAWRSNLNPDGLLVVRLSQRLPDWNFMAHGTPERHVLTVGPALYRCFKRVIERANAT